MAATTGTGYTKTDRRGAFAVAGGAAIWGIFWLPLRYLHEAGVEGLWAISLIMGMALLPALLLLLIKNQEVKSLRHPDSWLVGIAMGVATVLYFAGLLYSEVIKVIFLFYLLPVWTTLSARIIYHEPIRREQLLVILAALIGLWLLLGGGTRLPLPENIGDWCGIAAGMCWGISLSLIRGREQAGPYASTATTIFVGFVLALIAALFLQPGMPADSSAQVASSMSVDLKSAIENWPAIIALALVFGLVVLYPSMLGQIWGARRLPSPTAALLTMTEIVVATLSTVLILGNTLPPVAWLGGAIIVFAVCLDLWLQR